MFFPSPNPLPGGAVACGVTLAQTSFKTTHYYLIFKELLESPYEIQLFHGLNSGSHSSWKGHIMSPGFRTS